MAYVISTSILLCLVVILPSSLCQKAIRPFWRKWKNPTEKPTKPPEPTLPPIEKDPDFYKKLQKIPPKNETALKVITNIFRIHPGGKRSVKLEDVVIVMDGSGSIGKCEFNNGKKAMKSLMQYKQSSIDAKYAMITFANGVRTDFSFLPQLDAAIKIDGAKYPSGGTNTQAALAEALKMFKSGSRGSQSRKVALLLTDGQSNVKPKWTVPNAKKLKAAGVEVFVVAVGNQRLLGIEEMAKVASIPPSKFLFRVKKFGDFLEVVKLAIKEVAPGKYKIIEKFKSTCG